MKNWEEVYEKYKSGEMEQRYNELKEKVENNKVETKIGDDGKEYVEKRELTADEYKEFQSMKNFTKVKENIAKVGNILELKEKYKTEYKEMEVERARKKNLNAQKTMMQQIENDLKTKLEVRNRLTPFLYASDISDVKREEVKTTLEDLNGKIEELQEKYKTSIEGFSLEDNLKTKYSELSDKDLRKSMRKVAIKISKCDIVAGELMEGQSWDRIDYKLDNWNKYVDKSKIVSELTGKNVKEEPKTKQQSSQEQPRIPAPQEQSTISAQQQRESQTTRTPQQKEEELAEQDFIHNVIKKKENKPAKVSDFLTQHPRIAKIVNWFRSINPIAKINARKEMNEEISARKEELRNIVEREKSLAQEERTKTIEKEKARIEEEKEANEFKAYIREIAEKGSEGMKKEKFEAMKQAAYERETEKFGEEYAKKSYEPKQEQNDSDER